MKYGAAVVLGALGMFVSGYFLGYSTAVPDVLRAADINTDDFVLEEDGAIEVSADVPVDGMEADNPDGAPFSEDKMEELRLEEIQEIKKMIVPLLTDDEIKKYRDEAAARTDDTPIDAQPHNQLNPPPVSP